jgi:hypothetical protein
MNNSQNLTSKEFIRLRNVILSAILIIVAIAARSIPGPRPIDDSFITYRYARNILSGNGFVYNPGERIMGTTTPFYTFSMVLLAALTGGTNAPFPELALTLNTVADAITCVVLWQIGKQLEAEPAGFITGLIWLWLLTVSPLLSVDWRPAYTYFFYPPASIST